jgi:hypothetical protein
VPLVVLVVLVVVVLPVLGPVLHAHPSAIRSTTAALAG